MSNLAIMPTPQNTVMDEREVKAIEPRFAKVATLAKIYNVSKTTVYRWLKEAEQSQEWPKLFIEVTSSLTLVNLEEFERYLYTKHRKYL
ncbi:helix-turn-helix domain-containing protein [Macrococcus hajekii]|uniref:Helix-turn-helix domain-containing protein n=1 Tax=Macrococcus hajekii TaxID=198482 RepID=A0A4R6BNX1_9STAP|nr:helix-turn-helix domain-containing protein [Macrococcus hajekii]TDM03422.1 helix-turn-helix domain-containing protein [Macrococcus hajekii]GGA98734.1 hypothetical protein GCM10007190_03420 [Macrococcus hajekii]